MESLHQMRVSYRRLGNALRLFKDIFPKKKIKKLNGSCRRLVEISGYARDLDVKIVFLKDFKKTGPKKSQQEESLNKLLLSLEKERSVLQPKLVRAIEHLYGYKSFAEFCDFLEGFGRKTKRGGETDVGLIARKRITKRVEKLLSFEPVVRQSRNVQGHHQMRIAAKHLRYALEDFTLFYGKKIKPFIRKVRGLQRVLGEIHDYDVWIQILPKLAARHAYDQNLRITVHYLIEHCRKLRVRAYQRFVVFWKKTKKEKVFEGLRRVVSDD